MGRLSRPAAFLDRDGTINVQPPEHEYVTSERDFVWLPGAVNGLLCLASAGYLLAVVSNQRGVARGLVAPQVLAQIEDRIQRELARYGCEIAAFRYCIHDEDGRCDCRKPKPGLILDLARELDIDLRHSWMIGDSQNDVRAGEAAGCQTALLDPSSDGQADVVAPSLSEAAEEIARRTSQPRPNAASASNASTNA